MRHVLGIVLLTIGMGASVARAEVLAVCGASKGWAYYVPGHIGR